MVKTIHIFWLNLFPQVPHWFMHGLVSRICESPNCCHLLWTLEFLLLESLNGCHPLQTPTITTLKISWGPRTIPGTIFFKQHLFGSESCMQGRGAQIREWHWEEEWTQSVQKAPCLWVSSCRPLAVGLGSHPLDQKLLRNN